MQEYFETILSKYQCGFGKGYNVGFNYNDIKMV